MLETKSTKETKLEIVVLDTEVSRYELSKIVNLELVKFGIKNLDGDQKSIPSQMIYNYSSKKYIKINQSGFIDPSESNKFLTKYLTKQITDQLVRNSK